MSRRCRASYTMIRTRRFRGGGMETAPPVVAIADVIDYNVNVDERAPSISLDAKNVVRELVHRKELQAGDLLVYRDGEGVWDGIDWGRVLAGGDVEFVALLSEDVSEAMQMMRDWNHRRGQANEVV